MTPAFGFSAGDFISAINLIRKISKALKETGGASSDYQDAVVELKGLEYALQHLEALEPTEDNLSHVNAIRGMALACQIPLREFLTKLEKYEGSLGQWAERTSFRSASRKTRWAIGFSEEVKKLRALMAAKQITINLLLATHASQTLSSINLRAKQQHGDLMCKVLENRAALRNVHGLVEHVEDRIEGMEATSKAKLEAVSTKYEAIGSSIMSLRNLGEQVLAFISTFPQEIRDLLHSIMQADWRTYQAVLQIQARLARTPTCYHESNIRFTDALGEYRELPYEFFSHWEPFEGFLRSQFKNKPGESKVLEGHFHVIDALNGGVVIQKQHWNRCISQGAVLVMSMIMAHIQGEPGHCPRPRCASAGVKRSCNSSQLTCETCRLEFFPNSDDLENAFGRVNVSEEDVARLQVEEDLKLYGSRPEPSEVVTFDEGTHLPGSAPKPSASEFGATVGRPAAKVRKIGESEDFNYQAVTAMDWNSGTSPLDLWLNQSAVPSTVALDSQHAPEAPAQTSIAQEEEEIKVFRNVHVGVSQEPGAREILSTNELPPPKELGVQIYYRNIIDRYPLLPTYLAHRLAQANQERAERLQSRRSQKQRSLPWAPRIQTQLDNRRGNKKDANLGPNEPVSTESCIPNKEISKKVAQETFPCSWYRCTSTFTRAKYLRLHENIHRSGMTSSSLMIGTLQTPSPDFWTCQYLNRRPASVHSRSSSMNSSLRGHQIFDPKEQDPTFPINDQSSSSASLSQSSRGLPPPPANIGKEFPLECHICGDTIRVERRRGWQTHVLADLRPYVCTYRDCDSPTNTYPSLLAAQTHELSPHPSSDQNPADNERVCPFCDDQPTPGASACRHIGRHMEEIAVSVVSIPYKEWSFYSDSSLGTKT